MPIVFGKAPGKIILFGEHAVVYGQPAIAIPILEVHATARIIPKINSEPGQVSIHAKDLHSEFELADLPEDHPLAVPIRLTLEKCSLGYTPAFSVELSSTIPIAAGMGSSAAVSAAIIRALSSFLGSPLPQDEISKLVYQVELIHHGTPSGIDNTVIAYEKPVFFRRDHPIQILKIKRPTSWVIADSGEKTPTRETVTAVRDRYTNDQAMYDSIFREIGDIAKKARKALVRGNADVLGKLMNANQRLLEKLDISSSRLDRLIEAARSAGAFGAKLSGGGRGGNIIAAVLPELVPEVKEALLTADAKQVIATTLTARKS
jgi:mevalonate kinase